MRRALVGLCLGLSVVGCASARPPEVATPDGAAAPPKVAAAEPGPEVPAPRTGPWVGAAGASDFVLPGAQDTTMGVWIDVPATREKVRSQAAVALVVDVSGSMAGAKIQNARQAARQLVSKLADGDIVSIQVFSDDAREILAPTVLSARTRPLIDRVIASLEPKGGTNLFDGLRLGEGRAIAAPADHPVRRVVLISDGQANVGPSTPEVLGMLASRGADAGVQVTALGVGFDYDEATLNALALRSSGRLFHIGEPGAMVAIVDKEIQLLKGTAATGAFVEIVPAPGVEFSGTAGARADKRSDGSLRVPLGAMFGGQHREMLVRMRVTAQSSGTHPLASVRLHFKDPSDGNVDRVQEVVARYTVTPDTTVVARNQNAKTQMIAEVQEASMLALAAASDANQGNFDEAEKRLSQAETKLRETARQATSEADRSRALASASQMAAAKHRAKAGAAAPKPSPGAPPAPVMRAPALEANEAAMRAQGL